MTEFRRYVFQIVPKECGGGPHIILFHVILNFCPYIPIIPARGSAIYVPTSELNAGSRFHKPLSFHMPQPDRIMRCHDELGVREFLLQKGTDLPPMARVNRHEDIVENSERE